MHTIPATLAFARQSSKSTHEIFFPDINLLPIPPHLQLILLAQHRDLLGIVIVSCLRERAESKRADHEGGDEGEAEQEDRMTSHAGGEFVQRGARGTQWLGLEGGHTGREAREKRWKPQRERVISTTEMVVKKKAVPGQGGESEAWPRAAVQLA